MRYVEIGRLTPFKAWQPSGWTVKKPSTSLVRTMAVANPLWGAPRIHGELLKLGLDVAERTVSR